MKRILFATLFLIGMGWQAHAAELTPGNIIGRYKVSASVAFQKVYLKFHVINTNDFEIQRVYPSGKEDEVCNGTYDLNSQISWDYDTLVASKVFKGVFTCPSDRQKRVDFNIDFKNRTTDDLITGTTVTVTSSLAPGYTINAFVKKQ